VVILSADARPGLVQRLLEQGARGFLTKPLDVKELLEVLDGIAAEREQAGHPQPPAGAIHPGGVMRQPPAPASLGLHRIKRRSEMAAPDVDRPLATWNEGPAMTSIREFVARVTTDGSPEFVPPEERVAVFDNDGTLWCEKPMPIELGFILQRLAAMADQDPGLRDRQPWKAAYAKDYGWLGDVITKHYAGDDSDVKVLLGGILQAFAGMDVQDYQDAAHRFLHAGRHPTLGRPFAECGYLPMIELLGYLEANGFTTYIASGGDRDFMRPVTQAVYNIPAERVIGSSNALRYTPDDHGGSIVYLAEPDVFDDGPVKPVRIWSRVGRRPILAAGNSNGDLPMLRFAGRPSRPGLRLLVLHDDPEREFEYVAGSERALDEARAKGWTVVSIKDDWSAVFAG
jgi:phosphoserine phosphatase